MYGELYQYLVLHQQLHLPGIGTFSIERKPASLDFTDKLAYPPVYTIALQTGNGSAAPAKPFFHWLGTTLGVSDRDAVVRFNDFLFDLKNKLSRGGALQWSGLGRLSKAPDGELHFEAERKEYTPAPPVPATMVLRHNAEHTVLVGEQERTSSEMQVTAEEGVSIRRSRWWIAALAVGLVSVAFVAWYFSAHECTPAATGNQQRLVPRPEMKTHS